MAWSGLLGLGGASNPYIGLLGDTLSGVGIGLLGSQRGQAGAGVAQGLQYANQLGQQRKGNAFRDDQLKIAQQQLAIAQQSAAQQQQAFAQQQQQIAAQKAAAQSMFGGPQANQAGFRPSGAGPGASASIASAPPSQAFAGMDPAQLQILQQMAQADPGAAMGIAAQQAFPKPLDPSTNMKDYQFYAQQAAQSGQQPMPFNDWSLQQKRATANNTTLNMAPQESAFQNAYGGAQGKSAAGLADAAATAQGEINNLDALTGAVDQLKSLGGKTGSLAPMQQKATELMQAFNLDPTKVGLPANAGPYEQIEAITNQLTLQARNTANGQGMPGAMSDSDRGFLGKIPPSLSNVPEGLAAKVEIAKRVAGRQVEATSAWQSGKYEHTQAGYEKFQADWTKYNRDHPVFDDAFKKQVYGLANAAPAPQGAPAQSPMIAPTLPPGFN